MSEIIYAYRVAPCPAYDVEGMESWLTDMASQGLFLSSDGFFGGLGIFEKRVPHPCKYRLEAAPSKRTSDDGFPDREAISLSKEFGWTYVARRGDFYIYISEDDSVRELNTDPVVQALALNHVIKRTRSTVFLTFVEILFWMWFYTRGVILLAMTALGTLYTLFLMILLLIFGCKSVIHLLHLIRLKKKLTADGFIDHHKDWRTRAGRYLTINILLVISLAAAAIIGLCKFSDSVMDKGYIPLEQYDNKPPFATMADLIPDGTYTLENFIIPNEVKEWTTLITPVNIDWTEYAVLTHQDGTEIRGGISVYYHETAAPWIARRLAEEYMIFDKKRSDERFEPISISDFGLSYTAAYYEYTHFPCVVLQNGCKVMRVQFHQFGEKTLSVNEWAAVFAQSLR